jgi:hypothetical protein
MNLYLVIGHIRPTVNFPLQFQFVTGEYAFDNDYVVSLPIVNSVGLTDKRIGEYAFLFAARRNMISELNETTTIVQYRRMVINRPLGVNASDNLFSRVITINELNNAINLELFSPKKNWLISSIFGPIENVLTQYSSVHILRDWMRFCADAIDFGVLSNVEAFEASQTKFLIPAPSNGTFPTKILIDHLSRLESMALAYLKSGFLERDGYQRRSLGFCLERMHSYLILKHLLENGINPAEVEGYHTVVGDGFSVKPTI